MVTTGGYAQINSQSRFQGFIYAPSVNVGIYGKSVTYGGVTANNVTLDSSSNAIWDYTAGTSIPNYDILTGIETQVNWREAPP